MSEKLSFVAGCVSLKRVYQSEAAARWALIDIARHPLTPKIPDHVYKCPLCERWHLTSKKGFQRTTLKKLRPN